MRILYLVQGGKNKKVTSEDQFNFFVVLKGLHNSPFKLNSSLFALKSCVSLVVVDAQ